MSAVIVVFSIVLIITQSGSSSSDHDPTNSDGHHSSEIEETSDVTDLTSQTEVMIDIKDLKYSQADIKIKKGTKVTWINQDTVKHNVMQDHSNSGMMHDAPSQQNVDPTVFAGPLLAQGESYSYTFNDKSSVPYHCSQHASMKGSITVVE